MPWTRGTSAVSFLTLMTLVFASCQAGSGPGSGARAAPPVSAPETRADACRRLASTLDTFHVSGEVKTDEGLLLPGRVRIEIRSDVCVESRAPGSRFWSLEYDTCFTYVAADTVDEGGQYAVEVPCLDADRAYESRHAFGDLRLVQRGPVSFLADWDESWRHQETFSSSRSQTRNLYLSLDADRFYVIREEAVLLESPAPGSLVLGKFKFGSGVDVIRFRTGWALCRVGDQFGWMEMRFLGTEAEMNEGAPFKGKESLRELDRS